ncbi:methyltransferase domain-containing protein [Porphyromonadaceae bacterium W3.11]|nr:methyltransferase domain-containing protein [Porphyromonadaceae bacterium W3.11]
MTLDKAFVQKRFGQAVSSYDRAATPQTQIADVLVGRLSAIMFEQEHRPLHKVLEVGCGTGLFSQRMVALLGSDGIDYTFNDLSPEVEIELARKLKQLPYTFQAFDAEHAEWRGAAYDLIASSSCIQWWKRPLSFIDKAYNALNPQGLMVLSTFLPSNLKEIQSIQPYILPYPSEEELRETLETNGFSHYEMQKEQVTMSFSTLLELLRHLKETGTNALRRNDKVWTPSALLRLEGELREEQSLSQGAPLTLTYDAIIVTAVR